MSMKLTPEEAAQKIQQVESARDDAVSKLRMIQQEQEAMQNNWQGASAGKYQGTSEELATEFNRVIDALSNVVETGKTHMNELVSADS